MLAGRAARSGRHLARLLGSNPVTAAARVGGPKTAAQQQLQLHDCSWISSRSADSASCTGSAASSPGGCPTLAAWPLLQRQQRRGFADGTPTPGGLPREPSDGSAPPGAGAAGSQQGGSRHAASGRVAGGDASWQTPVGSELTSSSQPARQEGEVDDLLAKWEALMDAEADPMEVLDTICSGVEGQQVGSSPPRLAQTTTVSSRTGCPQ